MKEVDLVPDAHRTPQQYQRVALIKEHRALIENMIMAATDLALSNTVVVVLDEKTKNRFWPPDVPSMPPHEGGLYFMLGPREGFRKYLEERLPAQLDNTLFAKLDEPPPPQYVVVVVIAFGGITVTALGEFIVENALKPKSPNN